MLKFISYTALLIAIGVGGVLAYAATKPDSFQVARSLVIKAPPEKVFPHDQRSARVQHAGIRS